MIVQEMIDFFQARADASAQISEIVVNGGFTGVLLDNGQAGVAMNIRSGTRPSQEDLDFLQGMIGRRALDLAAQALASRRLVASAGVAALSALSQPYLDPAHLERHNLRVDRADFGRVLSHGIPLGSRVGIVGFGGAVWRVARLAREVVVTELEPWLFRSRVISQHGLVEGPTRVRLLPAAKGQKALASCDTVLITGCALVSQTLDELLAACRNSRIILYGPSASLLPLPLFRRPQVAAITTIRILDGPGMMDILANAGPAVERLFAEVSEDLYIERANGQVEALDARSRP